MLLRYFLLFAFLIHSSFATDLKTQYAITTKDFNASSIDPYIKEDFLIYQFETNKHQKKFTSSALMRVFEEHGLELKDDSKGVVHVRRTASIDFEPIRRRIKEYYRSHFPRMKIEDISIRSNSFIPSLPQSYELVFKEKAYLYNSSSLQVISAETKKRYFLSYTVQSTMKLFKARHNINRGKILNQIDLIYEETDFKRFKGIPIESLNKGQFRLKRRLAKGKILYTHDIERLPSVLKDKPVNVRLISGQVYLEFQATALQDGHIDEYIFVKKRDGKRLRARVVNQNLVEIE